ncbi:MAG TPA: phycobilisome rod-core linker polypeptide, partial [Methylomirabilota bacterium]|nr:phycobilisome rod-core linker polypeptide [Methylomirabilota bacterium]
YEMQGGRASPLWVDPSVFSFDEAYEAWIRIKRNFSSKEIIDQTWVKTSNPEHTFIVRFSSDGNFNEHALSDPGRSWQGSWELLDGKLRMRVNKYELDIFANQESSVHSGIEFARGAKEPHSYFVCFSLPDRSAKHWNLNEVSGIIEQLFEQILQQRVDAKSLITYGALLCRGEMSVRSMVKILGLSRKFKERFINLEKADETIELLYATFLGRGVDANRKLLHKQEMQVRGSNIVIADLIDSEEYQRNFGEDTLPPKSARFKPAHVLKQLKLS